MHLRSSVFLLIMLCGGVMRAQVSVSAWPQVRVEMVGTEGNGDPLRGLTAEMLQVAEDGKPVKIEELKPAAGPISVCILIDSSGSMFDKKDNVRAAATRLLAKLSPEDEACIVNFTQEASVDQELTTDRQADLKALSYLWAHGRTALYDTVAHVATYMRKTARQQSRVIVLLSDGADNASAIRLPDLRPELEHLGSPTLYLISIPVSLPGSSGGHSGQDDEKTALELVKMGGGFAYFPRNTAELEASVDHLVDTLKSRYVLTYQSTNPSRDGSARQIDVELDKVHQKMKAVLRAPEGYYAPSQ